MGCACSIVGDDPPPPPPPSPLERALPPPHVHMYGASWCPWCTKQVAELEAAGGKLTHIVHMCDQSASRCDGVVTFPTLVVETQGKAPLRLVGFHTTEDLERALQAASGR